MTLFHFLIVVQAIVAAALVGIILMQQSEGGGLGMGGSPSGLMSARGAANFLTRGTTVLAIMFVVLSIALAVVASDKGAPSAIDDSFQRRAPATNAAGEIPVGGGVNVSTVPGDPVPAAAPPGATDLAPGQTVPSGNAVPLDK